MKKLIAGNWKMNGDVESCGQLSVAVLDGAESLLAKSDKIEFLICPPLPFLSEVRGHLTKRTGFVGLGAQDCSAFENGAVTGDVSARMIKNIGCGSVLIGHSERREYFEESDARLIEKVRLALAEGLRVVYCVGETESQREQNQQERIVGAQLSALFDRLAETLTDENFVVAYEPVWAIGTGKVPSHDDIAAMHGFIRGKMEECLAKYKDIRIVYGGSVKPSNARKILSLENVDGALVGGASLNAKDFVEIGASVA